MLILPRSLARLFAEGRTRVTSITLLLLNRTVLNVSPGCKALPHMVQYYYEESISYILSLR
jgi:hypothetical protein